MEDAAEERQIQVRFVTKLPSELHVATTPFSLPAHLTRYGLSEVINALLGLDKPQPFDFLVDDELLRTSLEQLLLTNKLSAESILNVEYAYAVGPPKREKSREHKDWVSAATGSHARYIATGSYDTSIRIWGADGSVVQSLEGHGDAISSLEASRPTGDEMWVLISGSKDHTVRRWELSLTSSQEAVNTAVTLERPVKVLKGHTSAVQCVASNGSGTAVCSGSWDCSIKLWNISEDENGESLTVRSKKRKLDASAEAQELEVGTSITLEGHTQCVSAVSWGQRDSIVSASWDQSIRSWDVETNINTETLIGPKALHCLSVGGDNMALFAAGGADPILRIWDPRMPGTNTPIFQLSSHKAWITACKWHRHSRRHILSASHDGSVKLWDLRSKIPLQTIDAHKGKSDCTIK
ncbi:hypothetical protein GOP47_0025732 [Adiantum capillus-veneris]|uniref:Ribosome biogenesis protein WDR12 homolog n=1 Tax=Adiantum capillus-veneris TaxID=13818 RepID=A0A9D4U124_ADICA|nr:hypothetical protein GOP47_0025732 [Adiantum capillus-veneris]